MELRLSTFNYDTQFIQNGVMILELGEDEELINKPVRPKWKDGSLAYTIRYTPIINQYDLSKGIPLSSIRKLNWKASIDEMLWIWQKKSNNIKDLNSRIWDSWADENGSIGKAYGYQMGKKFIFEGKDIDQTDYILDGLSKGGSNRRLVTNLFNHGEIQDMRLMPCVWSVTFNVINNKLHAIVNQRSQDFVVANNWNTFQYSILVYMLCNLYNFTPGILSHVISDCHIYKRHIPIFQTMKKIMVYKEEPKISLYIKPVKSFYDYTINDIEIYNYNPVLDIKKIEVAV